MKIINNKKILFLVLILAAFTLEMIYSVHSEKKSQTVFEFFNGYNFAARKYNKREDKAAEAPAAAAAQGPKTNSTAPGAPAAGNNTSPVQGQPAEKQTLEDWFFISSPEFKDKLIWPHILLRNGTKIHVKTNERNYRLNPSYSDEKKDENSPPTPVSFWFRLTGTHLYYSYSKTDFNLAGAISIENIEKLDKTESTALFTIKIIDHYSNEYILYTETNEIREKWWIQINKNLGIDLPEFHKEDVEFSSKLDLSKIEKFEVEEKVIQPIIMVPLPRKTCNQNWTYKSFGIDWECTCSEGKEQSPIDLPPYLKAIDSPITPVLSFHTVYLSDHASSIDGLISSSELEVRYLKGAIRILYPNLGKLVTLDGTVYYAEEIVFHTPAEHTIDGVRHDMEMQVLHYGRSKGDIAKQAVVSFIFKKSPGMFSKFFDSFDIFQLPNQIFQKSKLVNDIDLNRLFYDIEYEGETLFKPFSFYTYQGSLTFPPCTERTIHYVASKPIPLGEMIIEHFREAIGDPTYLDTHYSFEKDGKNYRETQPLNDRDIFFFDHERYCGKDEVTPREKQPEGHFEKIMTKAWHYYHINTDEPSNLPGSKVITEQEAKALNVNN
jgi:carbonic anhydrase